jgi:hypothetical protein
MGDEVKQYLKKIGRRGGKKSASRMTKAQRVARARKAARARYAKNKGGAR